MSKMASFYMVITLILALCGGTLGEDSNRQRCPSLPKECVCSGNRVTCKNSKLRSIPVGIPLETTMLDLGNNEIQSLDIQLISRLKNLKELYLYKNQIRDVPPWNSLPSTLTHLSLHHNRITHLPSQNVTKKLSLLSLSLSSNRISTIGANAFGNITTLQLLRLNRNRLTSIPTDAIRRLSSLKKLDLSKNLIRSISSTLTDLKSLVILKLSKNRIHSVLDNSFWYIDNLRELYLDHNNLTSVSTTWVFSLHSLQKFYLNNNHISEVKTSKLMSWRNVLVLQELNLAKNKLSHIDASTFAHLSTLKKLYLGSNHIYHIAEDAFSDLHSLNVLDLSNNDLSSTLEEMNGAFTGLKNLFMLRLDGNRITWIAASAFTGLTNLKSLNLSANIITSIEENAFQEMENLELLFLNTTQLLCDCKLIWLPLWLEKKNFKASVHALCLHPKQLERRSIFNLTASDFVCDNSDPKPRIAKHPEAHTVLVGENVTLRCVVMLKNQTVRVSWKRNNKHLSGVHIGNHAKSKDGDSVSYTSELYLTSVKESDEGFYQCVASNQFAPVPSKMAKLTVWMYPRLVDKPANMTIKAGNTFHLRCKAEGHPVPVIAWQKDGGKHFPAADERRMDLLPNKVYVVRNATSVDGGKYTCTASNDAGSVNATAFVTVLEHPRLLQGMESYKEVPLGSSVVLQCLVSGNPQPSIAWFKDNQLVKKNKRIAFAESGQILVIVHFIEQDEGQYICEASNTEGVVRAKGEIAILSDTTDGVPHTNNGRNRAPKTQYVQYHKKTFLGIIVIVIVSCIVVTSLVWLLVIHCARRTAPRRALQHSQPFGAECSDESNSKAFQQEISYIPLKSSSSSSTQNSRDSPRSTATFLPALAEAAQGSTGSDKCAPDSGNASGNTSGTEEKSSTTGNASSDNSFKGSHCSLTSSCPSDACLPSYQSVTTSAQVHTSDSDSEKRNSSRPLRRDEPQRVDPASGVCTGQSESPSCSTSHEQSSLLRTPSITNSDHEHLPLHGCEDVSVAIYPLTNSDTSCVTDEKHADSPRQA